MERKCTNCGTWNTRNDFCVKCASPISPKEIEKVRVEKRKETLQKRPKAKLDIFIEKCKTSSNPFVRGGYHTASFLWSIYIATITFLMWCVAVGPG